MSKNQDGFAHIIILVAVVIAIFGAISYIVLQKTKLLASAKPTITSISPVSGSAGTNITLRTATTSGSTGTLLQYKVNINATKNAATATSADGGKTLSFKFPSTLCTKNTICAQVVAKPGNYLISVTDSQNQTSNQVSFKLSEAAAYFELRMHNITYKQFVIKLTNPTSIQHARDLLAKRTTSQPSVNVIIVKQKASYNPNWSFHINPDTVSFFDFATEVCDSSPTLIEKHLSEVGGSFLPGNRWCPWGSYISKEIVL